MWYGVGKELAAELVRHKERLSPQVEKGRVGQCGVAANLKGLFVVANAK